MTTMTEKNVETNSKDNMKEVVLKYVKLMKDAMPPAVSDKVGPALEVVLPLLGNAVEFIEYSIPYISLGYHKLLQFWEIIKPYDPHFLIPAVFGIILCFFGGSFVTIIAAVEAYR